MGIKSKRLKRFLYNLGFEFKLINKNGDEFYQFEETEMLKECIEFYYRVRKRFNK
ncbi:hypothetical protein LGL55_10470 [Clostridium tagluense]|uniref:hypothetical protein n=1 Tax=Clostridium tagluense TaxID=360422 RepID=UPI001CF561A4|nr:hypothetical protein [Clostridium tagluense]MCB2311637.1 hypothetical protein [Clostridium tagluense]MCB2316361.1 hypothetical protein [Clostridium tagluense]MCB2321255.1 hypothetical protein [Clostridium tagluense]MCB2326230.1 hypothetical protein [Clostridium tagluense]MCB2330991.1 hypothetical protein [Clostridium tagluense]